MANKTMAAKRLKLTKQIRKLPRQLPAGATPNRGVLNEYKERAKGLATNEAEIDDLIRRFYHRDPWAGSTAGDNLAVFETLHRLKELVPDLLFFEMIPQNSIQRLRCYFNSQKTCFVLSWDLYRKKKTLRSIEYPSRDAIVRAWNRDRIVWVSNNPIE